MTVKLFSRLNYTVMIPYADSEIIVPPYVRGLEILDEKKLGKLPDGIQLVREREIK